MPRLRPYRPSDWDNFIALDLETGFASLASDDADAFQRRWPKVVQERFAWGDTGPGIPGNSLTVLEADDGTYAGHLWLSEQVDLFSAERKLWITTVALKSEYRGRGWGRMLMERAFEEARARGLGAIGLGVDARNVRAKSLYEELGFQVTRLTMEMRTPTLGR